MLTEVCRPSALTVVGVSVTIVVFEANLGLEESNRKREEEIYSVFLRVARPIAAITRPAMAISVW
jgi:hypothetical protein